MSKQYIVQSLDDLHKLRALLASSAERTRNNLLSYSVLHDPIILLSDLKFKEIGCDPLAIERPLNLIEQVNQTFTYWATFEAVEYLLKKHPAIKSITLNLGTQGGSDIESEDNGGIKAEVFAAVTPINNRKLREDADKVASSAAMHKYVFFSCPGYRYGILDWHDIHPKLQKPNILIVSVGMYPGGTQSGKLT